MKSVIILLHICQTLYTVMIWIKYKLSPLLYLIYIYIYILSPLVYLIFILSPLLYLICLLTAGLDTKDLTLCPTDQHLVRLAVPVPYDEFHNLVIHLGLSETTWNNILRQYQGYPIVANFVALCECRQQKTKTMKKLSFKDLYDALGDAHYNQHVLCQVGNN